MGRTLHDWMTVGRKETAVVNKDEAFGHTERNAQAAVLKMWQLCFVFRIYLVFFCVVELYGSLSVYLVIPVVVQQEK